MKLQKRILQGMKWYEITKTYFTRDEMIWNYKNVFYKGWNDMKLQKRILQGMKWYEITKTYFTRDEMIWNYKNAVTEWQCRESTPYIFRNRS